MPPEQHPRIIRVIARLNIGGPARHAVILDAGLRSRGFETLLVHGRVGPSEGSLENLVVERGLDALFVPELGRALRPWDDARALVRLVRLVFSARPDIVHTHTAKGGALGRTAAALYNLTRRRGRRCLVVHTFHGHVLQGYFGPVGSMLARMAERTLARATDRIITVSEGQRDEIARRFKVAPPAKISVVPLGLELNDLLDGSPAVLDCRLALGLDPDAIVFGYMGRFVPIKDLPTLVRAFAAAVPRLGAAQLLLVGDGEQRSEIEHLAERLGVQAAVRFAGWRSDLPVVYGATDVAVLSSINEGTPVSLIEAMAAGRPVVATRVGGVPDIVRDGETGLLVPPHDPDRLAEAMVRLAQDPALRQKMGKAARSEAAARFRAERLVDDIAELYRRGGDEKRGKGSDGQTWASSGSSRM